MERRQERNYFALEVRLLEDEWTEREETGIAKGTFSGTRGWVVRPCGCELFIVHVSGFSSGTPRPGDAVSFRVVAVANTSRRSGYVGVDARVIERAK